jgi:hypothetical protein
MRACHLLVALGLVAIATPATAAEFYIVRDATTKHCTIVDQKPATTTTTVVGDGAVYHTRTEAETAMKSVKVCSDGTTGSTSTTTTIQR